MQERMCLVFWLGGECGEGQLGVQNCRCRLGKGAVDNLDGSEEIRKKQKDDGARQKKERWRRKNGEMGIAAKLFFACRSQEVLMVEKSGGGAAKLLSWGGEE
jgi:hypothetical protein